METEHWGEKSIGKLQCAERCSSHIYVGVVQGHVDMVVGVVTSKLKSHIVRGNMSLYNLFLFSIFFDIFLYVIRIVHCKMVAAVAPQTYLQLHTINIYVCKYI